MNDSKRSPSVRELREIRNRLKKALKKEIKKAEDIKRLQTEIAMTADRLFDIRNNIKRQDYIVHTGE